MRDIQSEQRSVNKWQAAIGLTFLTGLLALAIGTEMLVLSLWSISPILFWVCQGIWFLILAMIMSGIFSLAQRK